jgi:hypothetical protein
VVTHRFYIALKGLARTKVHIHVFAGEKLEIIPKEFWVSNLTPSMGVADFACAPAIDTKSAGEKKMNAATTHRTILAGFLMKASHC